MCPKVARSLEGPSAFLLPFCRSASASPRVPLQVSGHYWFLLKEPESQQMEMIGMERKGGLFFLFCFVPELGTCELCLLRSAVRTREEPAQGLLEENFSIRGGFCLGPRAAQFNEACWLLAGFRLAAAPRHSLSLGRRFLGTGLNLLPSRADLVVVCFLHTPIYRASAKLLNY